MRKNTGVAERYEELVEAAIERVRGRFLRPRIEHLAEAVAALAELEADETRAWINRADPATVIASLELEDRFDGAAAWERLLAAGVLDVGWASATERFFVGAPVERFIESRDEYEARVARATTPSHRVLWSGPVSGADVYEGERRPLSAAPLQARDALTIAVTARAVRTAEALGAEHLARMAALGFAPGASRALWRVLRPYRDLADLESAALRTRTERSAAMRLYERTLPTTKRRRSARQALELALLKALAPPEPWLESDLLRSWEDPQFSGAIWIVRDACAWAALAEHGIALEPHEALPERLTSAALDVGQNPFEPLVSLLAEGLHLEALYDEGIGLLALAL